MQNTLDHQDPMQKVPNSNNTVHVQKGLGEVENVSGAHVHV